VAAGEVTTDVDPRAVAASKSLAWRAQQADAKSLRGGAGRSDLPLETVKRLLCDCSFATVFEDENGQPLDVGRKQRVVSTALRRALHARDRGCTFPGCRRKRYLDGHHVQHWIDGGDTAPDNLTLLCTYHHRLLHEGAFRIVKEADNALRFVTADGRTIPKHGYRREDFVDDGDANTSAEGFYVREPAAIYRIGSG
jgi:hypothetical protein